MATSIAAQPATTRTIRPALVCLAVLTVVTGMLYPLATTGVATLVFPTQSAGSLIERDGRLVGSALIGQSFTQPQYLWGRLSATAPMPYNGAASGGSNLGPSNPVLAQNAQARIAALRTADPGNGASIPVDLIAASASGLDPHISPAAALYQAGRIARVRQIDRAVIEKAIADHTDRPLLAILGEPTVNVLHVNLALDRMAPPK